MIRKIMYLIDKSHRKIKSHFTEFFFFRVKNVLSSLINIYKHRFFLTI